MNKTQKRHQCTDSLLAFTVFNIQENVLDHYMFCKRLSKHKKDFNKFDLNFGAAWQRGG